LREALSRAPEGWFDTITSDGSADIYVRYRKSQTTGWTFALAMPATVVDGEAAKAYALLASGLACSLLLAFVFARLVSQRIAAPIAELGTITDDVRRGAPVLIPERLGVAEIDKFAGTLAECLDALRAREERLQLALAAGRMGHWEWVIKTNVMNWSVEMHAIHGLPPGSYSGQEAGNYAQYVHPADREAVRQATMAGLKHGEHHIEYRIIRPDGTLRWLEGRGRILRDEAGVPMRMLGLCTDITERKAAEHALQESETRFREIADTAPAILWITDDSARVTFLSRGWFEFTGQSEAQAFGNDGFGWLDAVHPDDRERSAQTFQRANTRQEAFGFDYRLRCAGGEYRWAMDAGKPRIDAAGRFIGFVGAVVDIDGRKRAEQALREADRHKDDFLATLSHELRNPLAALTTAAHVLRVSPNVDARSAAVHGVIERQTEHMVRLIEDLLDMTRIRLGKVSLRKAPLDLAPIVTDVTRTKRIAGDFDGRAQVTVDAEPVWVEGDAARLEQVYANLLDNALKFTPESGTIQVSLRGEGACAVLSVRDNGRGIAPETLPKIFDMFVQGDATPGRTQGGLGLGLALVRRLVELHHGSVIADSAGVGHGACFTVSLPLLAATNDGKEPEPRANTRPHAVMRVLLIEDNDDVRAMTRALLEIGGHEVHDAASGNEGLSLAAAIAPDVVLLDIGLPDIDGYEVASRLRAEAAGNRLVLVALSGHGDDEPRARAAGFDAHVIKPARLDQIVELIAALKQGAPEPAV
ncbi:MAG: PAS domain-containing protein, partial [Pseudomonadota bacterium]|nr:PAS domain-containing protein [Pseudomonadota bacterium]